jgi:hypothetical protein
MILGRNREINVLRSGVAMTADAKNITATIKGAVIAFNKPLATVPGQGMSDDSRRLYDCPPTFCFFTSSFLLPGMFVKS